MKYSCPSSAKGCPDVSECFTYSSLVGSLSDPTSFFYPFTFTLWIAPQPTMGQWVSGFMGLGCPLELTPGTGTDVGHPGALVGTNGSSAAEPCAQLGHITANRHYPGFCASEQLNASGQTCGTEYVSSSTETQVCLCLMASGFVELHARSPGKIRVYL